MAETETRAYTVEGMTCEHCRAAVSQSVSAVSGVDGVDIDLRGGRLEVRGDSVEDAEVEAAVRDAGYRVAESR